MRQAHILVEGQTEETFVRDVLAPHLLQFHLYLNPVILSTKRVKSGLKFKGGVSNFAKLRDEVRRLLGDSSAVVVTTMIDYYGLPKDVPGMDALPRSASWHARVAHLETALRQALGDPRFLPYLSLHEFEALLLVAPQEIETALQIEGIKQHPALLADAPEEVNDGAETHPAARLLAVAPHYRKTLHGPLIAGRIGLAAIRQRCPHLHSWLSALERLGN